MSTELDAGETEEKASLLKHVADTILPSVDLAPWASVGDKKDIYVRAGLATIGDLGEELERQKWNLTHKEQKAREDEEIEEFDPDKQSGGVYILGFCMQRMVKNVHNYAPSVNGLRTKQAVNMVLAQKSGVAPEPGKRSLVDRLTGKNKDADKVS